MGEIMVYILPMMLGRTFDMNTNRVGIDIFPENVLNRTLKIQNMFVEARHTMVNEVKEARNFLDVGGSFSLNVKSGLFKAGAHGAYLSDVESRENVIEMLHYVKFETVTMILPPDAKPKDDWKENSKYFLGTHYVRSVTYGGDLIASLRFVFKNNREKMHIKAGLNAGGRIKIFDIGVEVEGEYLKELSESIETMDIKWYSSVPLKSVPGNIKDFLNLTQEFVDEFRKNENNLGVPIRVELVPISELDSTQQVYLKNRLLDTKLDDLEGKLDDLLATRKAIVQWLGNTNTSLTDEQEEEIGAFNANLETTLGYFYKVIGNLDLSHDATQIDEAFRAYSQHIDALVPNAYYRKFQKLRSKTENDTVTIDHLIKHTAVYVHWGSTNCTGFHISTIYSGYAVGPSAETFGGGGNFLCTPENISVMHQNKYLSKDWLVSLHGATIIVPLISQEGKFKCVMCEDEGSSQVQTFYGRDTCPSGWFLCYEGFLLGGTKMFVSGWLCVDTSADITDGGQDNRNDPKFQGVFGKVSSGFSKLVPCVVCSHY
ncbi:uncharacterized protein LOC143235516 isoform X2 [Tachypleus tridentatus]|uniref:uncharacterized protein LOC143235516 isoform X2 n=1 Tax=Tachypleus tridentatus TaxID=6853 RepID=UPI003FD556F8